LDDLKRVADYGITNGDILSHVLTPAGESVTVDYGTISAHLVEAHRQKM
jgi:hypothetical protein